MYIRWLIFSFDFSKFVAPHPVLLLSIWFSGIIAILNGSGETESPWIMPLGIFSPQKGLSTCSQFYPSVFHSFRDKVYEFVGYLVHFHTLYYPNLRDHTTDLFCCPSMPWLHFSALFWLFEDALAYILYVICSSCPPVTSFLFFWIPSAAYKWVIYFFYYLRAFQHHT